MGGGGEERVEPGGGPHLRRPQQGHHPPAPPSIPPLTRTAASRMALTLGARPGREEPLRAPRMILKPALRNASRALNPRAEVSVPLG
ncbi:hypothetical protein GCM10020254_56560 [Streptomyces goshikiensis]